MSAVEVLSRDMWEEKHGILLSSSEVGGFGRAFLRGAEGKNKYCLKKKRTHTPKQASWLACEGFSISRDYSIMHSYMVFCYRRRAGECDHHKEPKSEDCAHPPFFIAPSKMCTILICYILLDQALTLEP